jgi:hypothetical protein
VVFNLTGGFKSLNGYLQTVAMISADRCAFLFEGAPELMEIPRLPVRLAEIDEQGACSVQRGEVLRRSGGGHRGSRSTRPWTSSARTSTTVAHCRSRAPSRSSRAIPCRAAPTSCTRGATAQLVGYWATMKARASSCLTVSQATCRDPPDNAPRLPRSFLSGRGTWRYASTTRVIAGSTTGGGT